jgi:hypothetical protein
MIPLRRRLAISIGICVLMLSWQGAHAQGTGRGVWTFDHRDDIDDSTRTWGALKRSVQVVKQPPRNRADYTADAGTPDEWSVEMIWEDPPAVVSDGDALGLGGTVSRNKCPPNRTAPQNCGIGGLIALGLYAETMGADGNGGWRTDQWGNGGAAELVAPPPPAPNLPNRKDTGYAIAITDTIKSNSDPARFIAKQLVPPNPAFTPMPLIRFAVGAGDGNGGQVLARYYYRWNAGASTLPPSRCFAASYGAGDRFASHHASYARGKDASALVADLYSKADMLTRCSGFTKDMLVNVFVQASVIIARYASTCFADDPGAASGNASDHADYARRVDEATLINNLKYKINRSMGCVSADQRSALFGDLSALFANSGL